MRSNLICPLCLSLAARHHQPSSLPSTKPTSTLLSTNSTIDVSPAPTSVEANPTAMHAFLDRLLDSTVDAHRTIEARAGDFVKQKSWSSSQEDDKGEEAASKMVAERRR